MLLAVLALRGPALGPMSPLPDRAVRFAPPVEYQEWWARTESCAGRRNHPEALVWYVVPEVSAFWTPQGPVVGRWTRGSDGARIVIAGAYLGDELVVRHEMLHALLDRGDHPQEVFAEQCRLTHQSWTP